MTRDVSSLIRLVAVLAVAGAGGAALLVPWLRPLARRLGLVDPPRPDRFHDTPVPLLGGAAIFLPWLALTLAGCAILMGRDGWSAGVLELLPAAIGERLAEVAPDGRTLRKLLGLAGGATILFLVGLLDDAKKCAFPRTVKLAGQLLAAAAAVGGGIRTDVAPGEALNILLTVLWILAVTNAFNLLDNMNGLVTGVASLSGCLLLVVATSQGQILISATLAVLVGTTAGFLPYNFPRARIFPGDAGSLVLGFLFATLSVLESYVTAASPGLFPVVLPVLVVAIPLFDTLTVVTFRLRRGAPVTVGDTNHLSHRLVRLGLSPRRAVLLHWLLTLSCGAPACLLPWLPPAGVVLVFVQAGAMLALVWSLVGLGERSG